VENRVSPPRLADSTRSAIPNCLRCRGMSVQKQNWLMTLDVYRLGTSQASKKFREFAAASDKRKAHTQVFYALFLGR